MFLDNTGRDCGALIPETSDGLLENAFIQALVKYIGEGSNSGAPGHGEQVMITAARGQVEEDAFSCGTAMQQNTPDIVLLHQADLLIRHHNLFAPAEETSPLHHTDVPTTSYQHCVQVVVPSILDQHKVSSLTHQNMAPLCTAWVSIHNYCFLMTAISKTEMCFHRSFFMM